MKLILPIPFATMLSVALLTVSTAGAQENRSSDLYRQLKYRDSLIFEVGFNQCRLGAYDSLISDDLEFYHDKGGITSGKLAFLKSVQQNICNGQFKPKRELEDSSLQVFPMYSNGKLYGAIQSGVHRFYIKEETGWKFTGAARFTHLWLLREGHWQLKRVLSFDHH